MLAPDLALTTPYRFMQCLRKNLKFLVNVRMTLTFSYPLFILILSDICDTVRGYGHVLQTSGVFKRFVLFRTLDKTSQSSAHSNHIGGATEGKCKIEAQMSWGDDMMI